MSESLAAKVLYTEPFALRAGLVDHRPGSIEVREGLKVTIVRRCYIQEFGHIEEMRKIYTQSVMFFPVGSEVKFYEVTCQQLESLTTTEDPKSKEN